MDQHLRNTQSDKAYEIHDQMPLNFMISHFKRFKVLQTHVENWNEMDQFIVLRFALSFPFPLKSH